MSDETSTVTVPLEGRGTNDDPFLTAGNGLIATLRYVRLALRFEAFRPIRHTNEFREVEGRVDEALASLAALPVATAGQDLREYARHKPGCASYMPSDSNCSCGLAAALRGAAAQADGEATCGAILNCALSTDHAGLHERDDGIRWSWHENIDHLPRRVAQADGGGTSSTSATYLRDALTHWLEHGSSIEAADDLRTAADEWLTSSGDTK